MSAPPLRPLYVCGGRIAGDPAGLPQALKIAKGRIEEVAASVPAGAEVFDARGLFLAPFAVDAHVHLAFAFESLDEGMSALLARGVAGALDLGMPERLLPAVAAAARLSPSSLSMPSSPSTPASLSTPSPRTQRSPGPPFVLRSSGPLLAAPGGYPTQSWGRDGYGLELSSAPEAAAAVARLAAGGAGAIKLSFDGRFPVLAPEVARAAAQAAHAHGLRVFAHALSVDGVRAALAAGADALAHTPTERLPDALVREAGARRVHVISTLQAYSGEPAQLDNLARLRAAGARLAYGTDLGNEGVSPGVSGPELRLLEQANVPAADILRAATLEAAALLGAPLLGKIAPGAPAHLLALAEDPLGDPSALARPAFLLVAGVRRAAAGAA